MPPSGPDRRGLSRTAYAVPRRDADRPLAQAPAGDADDRPPLTLGRGALALCIVLCYMGLVLLKPGLPNNLAFVDPLLGVVGVVGLLSMTRVGSRATATAKDLLPWFWVFLVGSFLGLTTVGFTFWAASSMLTTTLALLSFFAMWQVLDVMRLDRAATVGLVVSVLLALVALIADPLSYRPNGWFLHPNQAGHFGVAAGVILVIAYKNPWLRLLGVVSVAFTVDITGSFGSIGMLLGMGAVLAWRLLRRNTAILTVVLIGLVIATGMFLTAPEPGLRNDLERERSTESEQSGLTGARFDRSSDSRFEIWGQALSVWADNPLGIGPNGVVNREASRLNGRIVEVHSDPIGMLVDRGPIGLLGYIGMWAVIWMASKPQGYARVLIIGNWVQALFRETFHYRHLWLLLALLMVLDYRQQDRASPEPEPDEPALAAG